MYLMTRGDDVIALVDFEPREGHPLSAARIEGAQVIVDIAIDDDTRIDAMFDCAPELLARIAVALAK